MKPALDSAKVYRDAADYLCRPTPKDCWGTCDAINQIAAGDPCYESPAKARYESYFMPPSSTRCYWGEMWGDSPDEIHECRLLALCFMAAMVEAGDA